MNVQFLYPNFSFGSGKIVYNWLCSATHNVQWHESQYVFMLLSGKSIKQ